MIKDFIVKRFNNANKELRLTQYFASTKFMVLLFILMFIFATLITNIAINIIDIMIMGLFQGVSPNISILILLKPNIKYYYIYIVVYLIFLFAYIRLVFNIRASYKDIKAGQKGTSRFTTMEEIDQQYIKVLDKDEEIEGSGGIPIIRDGDYIYIDDGNTNNIIICITRGGKGEIYVLPMVDIFSRSKEKPSLIFNDPKGELTRLSYKMLVERGYEVRVINLLDLDNTSCFNPLQLIIEAYKNDELGEAQLLCKSFTFSLYHNPKSKEPMWEDSAMSLVNGLILALCEKCLTKNKDLVGLSEVELAKVKAEEQKVTLYTVATLLADLGSENTPAGNALDLYFSALPKESIAKREYATSKFSEGKTRASIFTVAMNKLQVFTLEKVAKFTSQNDFNLYDIGFGDKPVATFLIAPDFDKSLHSLNTIFINQLYYVLSKEASFTVTGKCKRKVKIILDEAGNMKPLDNADTMTTVCLGRNIEFTFLLQSYAQLEELYGKGIAQTIEGNCGNHIYLMSSNDDTSEKFSKMIGETTITVNSRSGSLFSLEKNQTESLDRRRLLDSSELRRLKPGEAVIVRTMKRTDLKGNKMEPTPIFAEGENSMKFRYEYLKGAFAEDISILDLSINNRHTEIKLDDLRINLDDEIAEIMHKNYLKQIEEQIKYNAIAQEFQEQYIAKKKREEECKRSNNSECESISEELKRKLRSSLIIKGAIGNEGIEEVSAINSREELDRWFNKYINEREHLIAEYKKILRKEGYDE